MKGGQVLHQPEDVDPLLSWIEQDIWQRLHWTLDDREGGPGVSGLLPLRVVHENCFNFMDIDETLSLFSLRSSSSSPPQSCRRYTRQQKGKYI